MEPCAHESIISFPRVLAALSGSSGHEVAAIEGSAVPSAFLVASTQAMGPHKALLIVTVSLCFSSSISPSYKTLPSVSETFPTLRSMIEVLNTDSTPRCLKKL